MKQYLIVIISIVATCSFPLFGQKIVVSENLTVEKLTEHTYIHTGNDNNGLIFMNNGEAVIVSTPETDGQTQELIDWVKSKKQKIVGYIIDRWHPDAMGGIKIVHSSGIRTYANELTRRICEEKGLPIPQTGFYPKLELNVGGEKIIAHYFGESHTEDGIVVWVPKDKVLFGGNGVRSIGGWYGNIGDANLKEWSNTISKVKDYYNTAEVIIPGHGKYGGKELLDYTINMYKPSKRENILKTNDLQVHPVFNDYDDILEIAQLDSIEGNKRYLKDAVVFVNHSKRYLKVIAPSVVHDVGRKMISSDSGRLQIFTKETNKLIEDLYYKQLYVNLRDDEVEWTIIIKEAIR